MSFFRSEPSVPLSFHDATVAALRQDLADQQKRYDALLETFIKKPVVVSEEDLTHWSREAPKSEPLHVAVVPPTDELKELVYERSAGDLRRRGLMLAQLRRDRADQLSDDEIRKRIEDGVMPSGVPA